jgi:hypothetical protein
MKRTYQGSCHCGAVRFAADLDLAQGTAKRNCSICLRTRAWMGFVSADDFRPLAGESSLRDYQFGGEPRELAEAPITFMDMLHDDFTSVPTETRYL